MGKVLPPSELVQAVATARQDGRRIVFTNGCFDLLHVGHVRLLRHARELGDVLIVGLNSDASVRRQGKGDGRPLVAEADRAQVLAALEAVDWVTVFDEDTPLELIRAVEPDVLVKGGDWPLDRIVGADVVRAHGGKVLTVPYVEGFSTTELIRRIRSSG